MPSRARGPPMCMLHAFCSLGLQGCPAAVGYLVTRACILRAACSRYCWFACSPFPRYGGGWQLCGITGCQAVRHKCSSAAAGWQSPVLGTGAG